jgi:hypothetical protein
MFFQTVFTSLLVIMLGLALLFSGYRFFQILISIWGFIAGFQFGASILSNWFGQGFLTTVIGWVLGLLIGIFAATLAYLFYAAAVVILAGLVGYQLGIGVMAGIGFNEGFVTFVIGLLVGLALVALAIYLHFPKVLILILTSLAGAELLLGGIFLALGRITLTGLRFGAVGAILQDSWFWGLLYLAIAAVGFYFQWRTTQTFVVEEYSSDNPFVSGGTAAATPAGEVAAVAASGAASDVTPPSTATQAADLSEPAPEANLDPPAADISTASSPATQASESPTNGNGAAPDTPSSAPEGAQ